MINMQHENPFGKILCRCYQVSNIAEKVLFNHLTNLEKHFLHEKICFLTAIIVFLNQTSHLLNEKKIRKKQERSLKAQNLLVTQCMLAP